MPRRGYLAIAIIAIVAAISVGAFLSASYSWTASYEIRPRTAKVTAVLNAAGATSSSYRLAETAFAHVEKPGAFRNEISFDSAQENKLESTFENLFVKVQIANVGSHEFQVVKEGTAYSPSRRLTPSPAAPTRSRYGSSTGQRL